MSRLTKQEIFDKVATHLLKQNRKSQRHMDIDPGGLCMYRGPDGLMCAAGILIDDDDYHPGLEMQVIGQRINNRDGLSPYNEATQIVLKKVNEEDIPFVRHLQFIHDKTEPQYWWDQLLTVAVRNNLDKKVLDAK